MKALRIQAPVVAYSWEPSADFDSEVNIMIEEVMLSQDLMNYLIFPGLTCNSAGTT